MILADGMFADWDSCEYVTRSLRGRRLVMWDKGGNLAVFP